MPGFGLYDLATQEADILQAAIDKFMEAGDTQEVAVEKAVAAVDLLVEGKVIAYACVIKMLEAEAEAIKSEEARLLARRKSAQNKATALRLQMIDLLPHDQKWKAPTAEVSFQASKAVQVTELDKIPAEFRRVIPETWAPDKTAIRDALKSAPVPGAEIVTHWSVTIK